MACVTSLKDEEGGVVYVEFLAAFLPLFLLFLGICQLSLLLTARTVVGHAAVVAARSAAVVLEDDPTAFGHTQRGVLSLGEAHPDRGLEQLLSKLGLSGASSPPQDDPDGPQQGARMQPIRNAAYLPLLALAPSSLRDKHERRKKKEQQGWRDSTLGDGVRASWVSQTPFAVDYTRRASSIFLIEEPGESTLATEPVGPKALITVRVTYFFQCLVPLVRTLMCNSLSTLLEERKIGSLADAETPKQLTSLVPLESRFLRLSAEASLPNQGALYYR